MKNYFTDSILSQDQQEDGPKDGNEVDSEPDDVVHIDPSVNDEGEWVLNKDVVFEYNSSSSNSVIDDESLLTRRLSETLTLHM